MSLEPYWADDRITLYLGKCEQVLPGLPPGSVDAIVTDPPAAVGFMGHDWDSDRGGRDRWVEWLAGCMEAAARCLKPGGHALVWSLPRTAHWTAWALEDAGLEIRDCIPHLFGSGFPKSRNVSADIDKAAGAEREVIGHTSAGQSSLERVRRVEQGYRDKLTSCTPEAIPITAPATEDAARWQGWGTALKPGQEMWWLARKPFKGTVAANVLQHGTGALNVDGCRVNPGTQVGGGGGWAAHQVKDTDGWDRPYVNGVAKTEAHDAGRWPPNLLLTHSAACEPVGERQIGGDSRSGQEPGSRPGGFADVGAATGDTRPNGPLYGATTVAVYRCAPDCPVAELDRQSGVRPAGSALTGREPSQRMGANGIYGEAGNVRPEFAGYGDSGGASRFYPTFRYQAKAPSSERPRLEDGTAHCAVKSLGLTRWLARLITPPRGTVLDLYAGTGPIAEACIIEGFRCVLIEEDPVSAELIRTRLRKDIQPDLFGGAA